MRKKLIFINNKYTLQRTCKTYNHPDNHGDKDADNAEPLVRQRVEFVQAFSTGNQTVNISIKCNLLEVKS